MKSKEFIYQDELKDDFAGIKRNKYLIDEKYKYDKRGFFWKVSQFVVYRIIMKPFAYIYMKCRFHHKIVNKGLLKNVKSCFTYGNHTLMAGDAFVPNVINIRKQVSVVVSSDNLSVPVVRPLIEMCGAVPVPETLSATKNFKEILKKRIAQGSFVMIYPEAHIWPYYTGIRNFASVSFKYPIELNCPTYAITNTFHKRKFSKKPKIITYIDGPFYADVNLPKKERQELLRNQVYGAMCERSKSNSYNVHTYIKGGSDID